MTKFDLDLDWPDTERERSASHWEIFYDGSTGSVGFGSRYGEQSYNGKPLKKEPPRAFWPDKRPLYDPFKR